MKKLAGMCLGMLLLAGPAFADLLTIKWQPNPPEENVTKYRVYWGTESRNYTNWVDVTDTQWTGEFDLSANDYYFAVTAIDSRNIESGYSEEVNTVPGQAPTGIRIQITVEVNP